LLDRGPAVSWLVRNLAKVPSLSRPQQVLISFPGSGKTHFVERVKKFLYVYDLPMRKDDLSRATTGVDLWFIDQITVDRMSPEVLNKVLDG